MDMGNSGPQVEPVYEKVKGQLVAKETNMYNVYLKMKIDPGMIISVAGIRKLFENIELILTAKEVGLLDQEVKAAFGKEEYSYQDLLDFMVRKRVDNGTESGAMICMSAVSKALKKNGVGYSKAFALLNGNKGPYLSQHDFVTGIEGMQLGLPVDDIIAVTFYFSCVAAKKKNEKFNSFSTTWTRRNLHK
jgi:hypothetical protein